MIFEPLELPDVWLLKPRSIEDERGIFREMFRHSQFEKEIGPIAFVQENQSVSNRRGTVRGLHFQTAPMSQGKLVQCLVGAIFDVALDIRPSSPSFGHYLSRTLLAEDGLQLWIPAGFAHGFCTLVERTVVSYKVSNYYSPAHDRGVAWNDPALKISWPVSETEAIVSPKDQIQPRLADLAEILAEQPDVSS
ncbi:dTDP-4-dehydrorhamnose 3,5-epimerase [Rhizobium sp. YIM 134829]|uniref:dTDP-4-dehydrorhamnose 3,5-epimerase n=1 Tax=Rhizobium sp. YIM 134829 TaxID=3390453 RepID=UPI00397998F1